MKLRIKNWRLVLKDDRLVQLLKIVKKILLNYLKIKIFDLIAFGHNHQMHLYDDNKTIYFNPGAVGLNNGANAVYGIVTINDNEFSIERIKLPYDNEEYLQGFDEKQVRPKQLILNIFISCKNRG